MQFRCMCPYLCMGVLLTLPYLQMLRTSYVNIFNYLNAIVNRHSDDTKLIVNYYLLYLISFPKVINIVTCFRNLISTFTFKNEILLFLYTCTAWGLIPSFDFSYKVFYTNIRHDAFFIYFVRLFYSRAISIRLLKK